MWPEGPAWKGVARSLPWATPRMIPVSPPVDLERTAARERPPATVTAHPRAEKVAGSPASTAIGRPSATSMMSPLPCSPTGSTAHHSTRRTMRPCILTAGSGSPIDPMAPGALVSTAATTGRSGPGTIDRVTDELTTPHGVCFLPEYMKPHIVETVEGAADTGCSSSSTQRSHECPAVHQHRD